MQRFLDWLDEAAGGLIRLTYLLAGITAVAVYFGADHLPTMADAILNAALPWLLAFSLETHTYLTARRVRAAWQERDRTGLRINLGVLVFLLAFSAWNQYGYVVTTWTPPQTALALPLWLAYAVRALIVPAAFMCAAFLAPLAEPVTAQIEAEARATLADVFKIARKQRRRMLKEAEHSGRDMTGALVELVHDPDTRRIIAHAYGTIRPIERPLAPADESPDRPPTGPGSPSTAQARTETPALLRLKQRRSTPAARSTRVNGGGVRTGTSREAEARSAWSNGYRSVTAMERATGMSRSAAGKWVRTLKAEDQHGAAQVAR